MSPLKRAVAVLFCLALVWFALRSQPKPTPKARPIVEELYGPTDWPQTATGELILVNGKQRTVLQPVPNLKRGLKSWGGEVPDLGFVVAMPSSSAEEEGMYRVWIFRDHTWPVAIYRTRTDVAGQPMGDLILDESPSKKVPETLRVEPGKRLPNLKAFQR